MVSSVPAPDRGGGTAGGGGRKDKAHGIPRSSFMQVPLSMQSEQLSRGRKVFEELSSYAKDKFQIEDMTARGLLRAGQLGAAAENEVAGGSLQQGMLILRHFSATESRQHSKLARQMQEQFYQPLEQAMARHAELVMRAKVGVQRSAQLVQETETRLAKAKRQVTRALGDEKGQRDSLTKGINDGRSSQKDIDWLMGKASRAAESVRHAEALVAGERHILLQAIQARDDAVTSAARSFEMAERERSATIARAMTSFAAVQSEFYAGQMRELEAVTKVFADFDPGGDVDKFIEKRKSMDHVPLYRVALSLLDWAGISDQEPQKRASGSGGVGDGGGDWGTGGNNSRHARSSSITGGGDGSVINGGSVHGGGGGGGGSSVVNGFGGVSATTLPVATPLSDGRMRALPSMPAAAEAATVFGQRGSDDGDELHASQEMVDFSGVDSARLSRGAVESSLHDDRHSATGSVVAVGDDGDHAVGADEDAGATSEEAKRRERDEVARIDALLRGLIPDKKRDEEAVAAVAFPATATVSSPRSPTMKTWVGGGQVTGRKGFILGDDEEDDDEEESDGGGGGGGGGRRRDRRHSSKAGADGDVIAAAAAARAAGASGGGSPRADSTAGREEGRDAAAGAAAAAGGVPEPVLGVEGQAEGDEGFVVVGGEVTAEQARKELEVLVRSESGRSRFLQVLNERRSEATEVTPEAYDALVGTLEVFLDGCGPAPPPASLLAARAAGRGWSPAPPGTPVPLIMVPPSRRAASVGAGRPPSAPPATPATAPLLARGPKERSASSVGGRADNSSSSSKRVPPAPASERARRFSSASLIVNTARGGGSRSAASPPGSPPAGAFVGPASRTWRRKSGAGLEAGGGSYSKGEGDAIEVLDAPAAAAAAAAAAASEEDEEERADSVSSEATSLSSSPEDTDGDGGGGSPRSCFSLSTAATSDRLPPGMRLGPASRVIHGKPPAAAAAAAAVAAPASATAVATPVPSTPHVIKPGGMHSSVSGRNGARQQKSTGANLFEFAASIMRGNSSSGGGGPGRGWGGGGRGAAGWSDVRGGGPGGKGGGSTSASGVRGGGENMANPGWFDQTPFSTPGGGGGGHYPAHSATAQGALAETVELALGRGRTTTASRGQGAGGLFDHRGEGGGTGAGNGMEGYLDIRSARQAMILANTFFKTEKGGGSAKGGEGGGVDSKSGGGRQGRTYLLRELRDHPLWKHPRFWHEALMLGVKEQLQEGPANASRWDDLHGEARREAVARTHNVVFSQLASIAFNMLECGVDGARVRSDVTRKCRESQLGEAQVQELLRDLDRRIRLSDGDPADESLQAYSLTSPASDGKNPPRTGTNRPATSAVGVSPAASGVVPSASSTKTKTAFAAGTPAADSTTAIVAARAGSRSAATVGESNTTAVAVAAASGRKFAASDAALAGGGGSVIVDLPRAVPVDISPLNAAAAAAAAAAGGLNGDSPAGHLEQGLPNVVSELIRVCVSDKDEYREDAWRAVVRLALAGAENDSSRTRESSSNEISPPPPSKAASTGGGASPGPPEGVTSGPVARAAAADGEEREIVPATEGLPSERTALAPSLSGRLAAAFSRSLATATGDAPGDASPAPAAGERVSQDAAPSAAAAAANHSSVGGPAHQSAVRVLFPTADGSSSSSSAMEALSPGGDASGIRERADTSVSQAAFTAGTRERASTCVSQAAFTTGTRERAGTSVSQAAFTAGTRERAGTSVSQAAVTAVTRERAGTSVSQATVTAVTRERAGTSVSQATVTAVTRERAGTSVSQVTATAVTRERAGTSVSQAAATAEMTNDEEYDML